MIPVSFDFKGTHYSGHLSPVFGAGDHNHFYLYIDKRYYGQLRLVRGEWVFGTNTKGFETLADYLGEVVVAWYQ